MHNLKTHSIILAFKAIYAEENKKILPFFFKKKIFFFFFFFFFCKSTTACRSGAVFFAFPLFKNLQVRHKSVYIVAEAGYRLEILALVEEELYYLSSENKGADQLFSYCTADLHLCFHICKNHFSLLKCDPNCS